MASSFRLRGPWSFDSDCVGSVVPFWGSVAFEEFWIDQERRLDMPLSMVVV